MSFIGSRRMTDATKTVEYPTADAVAVAVVTACKHTNESPEAVVQGSWGSRARHYAAQALVKVYQNTPAPSIARMVGAGSSANSFMISSMRVISYRKWFKADIFNDVLRAVSRVTGREVKYRCRIGEGYKGENHVTIDTPADQEAQDIQDAVAVVAAEIAASPPSPRESFRLLEEIVTRKPVVPFARCKDFTAEVMGDPRPGRSALDQREASRNE
jgi:hypothetical protein